MAGDQFSSGFTAINPNSKIPAAVDYDGPDGKEIHLSESASIVVYLAKKYNRFIPTDSAEQIEVMNWIFWQMAAQVLYFFCNTFLNKPNLANFTPNRAQSAETSVISWFTLQMIRLKPETTALRDTEWRSSVCSQFLSCT